MSAKKSNPSQEFCAIDAQPARQGGRAAIAQPSRVVIRDKSQSTPSRIETERLTIYPGRGGRAYVIAHPIPDEKSKSSVAHVDWLGVTVTLSEGKAMDWFFEQVTSVFGLKITAMRKAGWNGYSQSAELGRFGIIAWGGKAQRGTAHIEIDGVGCAQHLDWKGIEAWGVEHGARITRIDLAHDDLDGRWCNIERTLEWHESGGFNCGGRNSKVKLAGDWHDLTDGRTVYVGTRGNKMLRCYEKGKELKQPDSPWFRVELELRNKNRVLPWDMLTRPGQYLAGAYPCLAFLSTEQCKLRTTQKATKLSLGCMTDNAARLSGKAINVLMELHKEDAGAVVDLLRREGIPKRLEPYLENLKAMAKGIEP